MFRHFTTDIISYSSYGHCAGSLKKWASGLEDPLSLAVHDFPLLGTVVSHIFFTLLVP